MANNLELFQFITAIAETIFVMVLIVIAVLNKDKGGKQK